MPAWDCHTLRDVYRRLVTAGVDFVLVGGQAVNLWSEHYRGARVFSAAVWQGFLPFTSDDLDLFGGSLEVLAAGEIFGVEAHLPDDPFGKVWLPNSGTLFVPMATREEAEGGELMIQFLHTARGLSSDDVRASAQTLDWDGVGVPVLHPMLCLEGKLDNLWGLNQERPPRQDLKHARLSVLNLHGFLIELLAAGQVREVLRLAERTMRLAGQQQGLKSWHGHGLGVEEAIPLGALAASARAGESKAANFLDRRWEQLQTILADRRGHFADLLRRQGREPAATRSLLSLGDQREGDEGSGSSSG